MYSANAYTRYEIDVNKRVRHGNETPVAQSSVDFTAAPDIPVAPSEEPQKAKMINLEDAKEKKSDEANSLSKFWNWATQLF